MAAQHPAVEMHDLAPRHRLGMHLLDHVGVLALRHKADVLAVVLFGDFEPELARQLPHRGLAHPAQRKPQELQLRLGRRKQEIALVAPGIDRPEQPPLAALEPALHIVPRRQHIGAELLRHLHQVDELHRLVARNARHRRLALPVGIGERLHHRVLEALFIVEHVVRNAELRRHPARIVDILAGTARALAVRRLAMIVKLQGNAHHVIALAGQEPGHHRAVDAPRHRNDDARVLGTLGQIKRIEIHLFHPVGGQGPSERRLYRTRGRSPQAPRHPATIAARGRTCRASPPRAKL